MKEMQTVIYAHLGRYKGDPLSHNILFLCMEVLLDCLLQDEEQKACLGIESFSAY